MTAIADIISPADRARLAARLGELRELTALMRERGGMPRPAPPEPLHRMAAKRSDGGDGERDGE